MNRLLSMNQEVGQASRLSCSVGFQPALTGRMPVLLHRQDACATNPPRFMVPLRAENGVGALHEPRARMPAETGRRDACPTLSTRN
jgi:hypothetical protein